MNVLLIRPPVPRHTIGLKHVMICEPLELEYVAAGIEGHAVQILDLLIERGLDNRLRSFRPDVVGTSCYITGVDEVKRLCRRVKEWSSSCITVVGGVHASAVPEDFSDPSIDCIVLGDGTSAMPEILKAVEQHLPLADIPGLALPAGEDQVIRTAYREYMPRPDSLPFPRRDLVAHLSHRYYYLFHQPVATVKTAWGCWYDCDFCFTCRVTDGMVYWRSPESIVEELAQVQPDEIYIVDDIFLINPERLARIAELLRQRKIRKKFLVYARADFVAEHEEIIREWSALGLRAVIVGLEAATDTELDALNKHCTVDHNRRAVEVLRRNGVDTYGSLIPLPEYLPQDWHRLWRFIQGTGLYYVNISPLTPLPGTRIWKDYREKIVVSRKAHALWDLSHCVLPTRMPLKRFYRSLLGLYAKTLLDIGRANRLTLRTRPPVWSRKYLRLWLGAVKIMFQFINAHQHHSAQAHRRTAETGRDIASLPSRETPFHSRSTGPVPVLEEGAP